MKNSKVTWIVLILVAIAIWSQNLISLFDNWQTKSMPVQAQQLDRPYELNIQEWAILLDPIESAASVEPTWQPFDGKSLVKEVPKEEPKKPEPQPKPPPKPRLPPFSWQYVGFIENAEEDHANEILIYMKQNNNIRILKLGDPLDDWRLGAIEPDRLVFLTKDDQEKVVER
jgi:hypothetical protein